MRNTAFLLLGLALIIVQSNLFRVVGGIGVAGITPSLLLPLIVFMGVHDYSLARGAALSFALGYLLDVFAAPERDRYQLISEHKPGHVIAEDTGLGIERTDDLVILQITQQGRDLDQKRALYATLAERLEAECGLAPSDLIVSLTENTKEDWSFGHGVAQFVEGLL